MLGAKEVATCVMCLSPQFERSTRGQGRAHRTQRPDEDSACDTAGVGTERWMTSQSEVDM